MRTQTYSFNSILQRPREILQDEEGREALKMEYDIASVREHRMELTVPQIMADRSWVSNFFIAFMSASALCALVYGLLSAGFGLAFRGAFPVVFLTLSIAAFLALWVLLSVRGAVKNLKRKCVEEDRGKGNWIIVDSDRWDRFYRIITAPKEAPEQGVNGCYR